MSNVVNELKIDTHLFTSVAIEDMGVTNTTNLLNLIIRELGDELTEEIPHHRKLFLYNEIGRLVRVKPIQFLNLLDAAQALRKIYGEIIYIRAVNEYSCNLGVPVE